MTTSTPHEASQAERDAADADPQNHILHVDIGDVAANVTTRPVGAAARRQLLALLEQHDVIRIDFHDRSLTPSFADECIGQLAARLGLGAFKQRVKLKNLTESSKPLVKHVVLTRCSAAA